MAEISLQGFSMLGGAGGGRTVSSVGIDNGVDAATGVLCTPKLSSSISRQGSLSFHARSSVTSTLRATSMAASSSPPSTSSSQAVSASASSSSIAMVPSPESAVEPSPGSWFSCVMKCLHSGAGGGRDRSSSQSSSSCGSEEVAAVKVVFSWPCHRP